tara:strand:- start:4994 stop:5638 length:645 start_codon:yes stop_codon:yes gene_type:complete
VKDFYWLGGKTDKSSKDEAPAIDPNNIVFIADTSDSDDKVERIDNRIWFYSEVTRPKILELNKEIRTLGIEIANSATRLESEMVNIYLHINSYGGSVFAGLSAVDYIKRSKAPITSIVDGCAASAATLISVSCSHRVMSENSFMLIHQLSSGMWGTYEHMKDEMENCEALMTTIKKIYNEHTKIPKRKLNQILKRDLWFDAKTCLEYGLVDDII